MNGTALQAPTIAVVTLVVGIGVVMLGALTVLVWSGRRRKHEPPQPEPPPIEVHWIWKLLAILLLLALGAALVAAAVIGSKRGRNALPLGSGLGTGGFGQLAGRSGKAVPGFVVPSWLPWTLLGIVAAAALAGVVADACGSQGRRDRSNWSRSSGS